MNFATNTLSKRIKTDIEQFIKTGDQIVVRFPPETSGYMHLGHIKALYTNASCAKVYNGKLIIRMDDTNPATESMEYEKALLDDIKKLGISEDNLGIAIKYTSSSDYFDLLHEYIIDLIVLDKAYVESDSSEDVRKKRESRTNSDSRSNSVEKNLALLNDMRQGKNPTVCVRLKVDMSHKNSAMRDPILYRTCDVPHYKTGTKYHAYPTYDYACAIVDSIEGVTHVFRSTEFIERNEMMDFILDALSLRKPMCYNYGRITLDGGELSKRVLKKEIAEGKYSGWDDPRLFTVKGMLNAGINLEAIEKLMIDTGYNDSQCLLERVKLYTINNKIIDKIATRYVGLIGDKTSLHTINVKISDDDATTFTIPSTKTVPRFVRNKELGDRDVCYTDKIFISNDDLMMLNDQEEVTLLNFGNCVYDKKTNSFITKLTGDPKTTKLKILWLPTDSCVTMYVTLIDDDKITQNKFTVDSDILNLKVGDYVQIIKYYYCALMVIDGTNVYAIKMRE